MARVKSAIDGVVIGVFMGFGEEGVPLVVFAGNPEETAQPARSLSELSSDMVGKEVALLFQEGDPRKPLIVGRIVEPARRPGVEVIRDGKRVRIRANDRLELRCGKASIVMDSDGQIVIRGTYLVSHSSGPNYIRGGSINLN
ncbi:DUF6484 domain-containing protein [Mesorhizobium sp. C416B]|uniref:DUF6484 domain-containing protein n=1 Tax=unclassified Mesorhizobium TaxID=325217 RepID=UPI0003CF1A4C|nr:MULTISPECIES: DUF6484 domain-containing protein [unclassified Mesorhizobium]ESX14961.1 hypothetical protein X768_01355 [Mesorhizobium sp. LSJC265A00]ESX52255.1 hypothetical protein X762_02185 [Mesorhizobium sp. LSHC426A00]ESX58835.1 hypothetical protein X761_02610 [Mesorhizobium sp. LSHC424B00]ESX76320.1 hypothetical protein X758_01155 [Mesorhizobium sp. LSHC416B00]ESY06253.1 hypothetical protein X753_11730 [Mesorhizobium sp. LNJC399B00]